MASSNHLMDVDRLQVCRALLSELRRFKPQFESQDVMEFLAAALQEYRCTVVLGSGVSKSVDLPMWNKLLDDLAESISRELGDPSLAASLKAIAAKTSPLVITRYFENIAMMKSALADHVRKCLYASYDQSKESALLSTVAETLENLKIFHVVTYNFDNSLERCLDRLKISHFPVHNSESYAAKRNGLRIYHPHGMLPHPDDDTRSAFLDTTHIFSERNYNALYMDAHDWANRLQLHHFSTRCCLFLGLSMTDPSIRRLLDFAKKERGTDSTDHVTIQRAGPDMLLNALFEREMRSLGVKVLWITDHPRITEVLRALQSRILGTR